MQNLPMVKFRSCPVLRKNDRTYFVWALNGETRDKISKLLGVEKIDFGFNSTLEEVPPFFCPECDIEITFFDQVRTAFSGGAQSASGAVHSAAFLIKSLEQKVLVGNGAVHNITCENGHLQPILMGWASNFGWTYD
ncbi:hypothetical protein WMF38_12885 [Sorangium sp. So ce118]